MRTLTMAAVLAGCLLQAACGDRSPASPKSVTDAVSFDTSVDTRQLMNWMIDPSSKVVFGAVATIITEQGEQNVQPHTDEEWNRVRNNAVMVLEAGNLLMLEGRARPSSVQDVADWNAKARAMSAAARTAIEATDVKDPEALFAASGDIYQTCTDCHEKYIFTAPPDGRQ
ncbi:cytochrome c [Steroidobacter agaridevorans]|uniref:cytochrome c n=1 Tax=Steroidobacter agaridevorans TaxID=2695856 RepID=UPI001AD9425D|nr:cytochrome c [Steroidobacter agaridevorans]